MDLDAALAYLDRHTNLEATAGRVGGLSLERMRALVAALGDPQVDVPVVHVTGTNGKGSTVRMIARLLAAQGLSVGTYTSPHLERLNERLAWDGRPVADEDLAALVGAVALAEPTLAAELGPPSYFEILTAAAFRWFADLAVDVAVVEVGLLGRWDATNVADGRVAVITNIGRDHTDGAEGWREAIAREKAGIVKPGSTLVLGESAPALRPVFDGTDAATIWRRDEAFGCVTNQLAVGGRLVDLRTPAATYDQVFVPAHGAHQGDNAAMAVAAAEAFVGRPAAADVVDEAFAGLELPGRFEIVGHGPLVVLDGAHNPDGARTLRSTLEEGFSPAGRRHVVVGLLGGRDPQAMLEELGVTERDDFVLVAPASPRAVPAAELAAVARDLGLHARTAPSVEQALESVLAVAGPEDVVVVAGSLYVVGPARAWCRAHGLGGRLPSL
ncbi:MAG TPA: Mur ligase family protein [Acidimicrobiales bacterium]|nr:Mur ligase family protein [Acidimicrobiales bacterium]